MVANTTESRDPRRAFEQAGALYQCVATRVRAEYRRGQRALPLRHARSQRRDEVRSGPPRLQEALLSVVHESISRNY